MVLAVCSLCRGAALWSQQNQHVAQNRIGNGKRAYSGDANFSAGNSSLIQFVHARHGDLQERHFYAGYRNAEWKRSGNLDHLNPGGGFTLHHGCLRGQYELQHQHFPGPDPDRESRQHHLHGDFFS